MFTGHAALAVFAKRRRPSLPLPLLLLAVYASDEVEIVCNVLGVTGREHIALLSHSVLAVLIMGTLLALGWSAWRRDPAGGALLVLCVFSHWPADVITGGGKPTWPGGPTFGLVLYDHHAWDFLLEAGLVLAAAVAMRGARIAGGQLPRWRARLTTLTPALLIAAQLGFNVTGYLELWDWKKVMLDRARAVGRAAGEREQPSPSS